MKVLDVARQTLWHGPVACGPDLVKESDHDGDTTGFPLAEKAWGVLSILAGEMTVAEAARRSEVSERSVGNWKRQFLEAGRTGLAGTADSRRCALSGSRDCTKLVDGVHKQLDRVRSALERADLADVPVRGMLCFVEADWPLMGGAFTIADLDVLWPKKAVEYLDKPGPLDEETVQRVHRVLADAFPPA